VGLFIDARLSFKFLEWNVQHAVLLPVLVVEVPPLVGVHGETFGFERIAEYASGSPLLGVFRPRTSSLPTRDGIRHRRELRIHPFSISGARVRAILPLAAEEMHALECTFSAS
jgi:hypothetical protein